MLTLLPVVVYQPVTMKVLDVPQSGSQGSKTASRNRGGQYIRQRAFPVQPRSAAQVNQRARLTTNSAAWRALTSSQMAAWIAFGNSFTITNSLGVPINLTGAQAYNKVNCVNLLNGDAVVNTPPPLPSFVAVTVTALTAVAATPALKLTGTSPASGTKFMVYCSAQVSAGVNFMNNWRYIETFTAATSGSFDITAAWTAKFGALIVGKKIFAKVVQSQSGMQDNGALFSVVVS